MYRCKKKPPENENRFKTQQKEEMKNRAQKMECKKLTKTKGKKYGEKNKK